MKKILAIISILIFISACNTSYYLKPTVSGDSYDVYYNNGIQIVISQAKNSTLFAYIKRNQGDLNINLEVLNNNIDNRFDFIPHEHVSITGDKNGKSSNLKVYDPVKYLKRMKRRQNTALILSAVAAGMENAQKGTTYSTSNTNTSTTFSGTGSSNTSGFVGNTYGNVNTQTRVSGNVNSRSTTYTTTYDQSKVDEANWRSEQELRQQAASYENMLNATEAGLIKIVTLFPEQKVSGIIKAKHKKFDNYTMEVTLGNDTHVITFKREK